MNSDLSPQGSSAPPETKSSPEAEVDREVRGSVRSQISYWDRTSFTIFSPFVRKLPSVIHGGSANGLTAWRDDQGRTLKQIEESATGT